MTTYIGKSLLSLSVSIWQHILGRVYCRCQYQYDNLYWEEFTVVVSIHMTTYIGKSLLSLSVSIWQHILGRVYCRCQYQYDNIYWEEFTVVVSINMTTYCGRNTQLLFSIHMTTYYLGRVYCCCCQQSCTFSYICNSQQLSEKNKFYFKRVHST